MYSAKIILRSISHRGVSLTTWELTYPRFVHAELMTHRMFSRNSASSRAIPNEKLRARIAEDPVLPIYWGANQKGMQAKEEISEELKETAKAKWIAASQKMLRISEELSELGVHKQLANRLIEPWMWITVIVTATDFANWYHLRDSEFAQPEIRHLAVLMKWTDANYNESKTLTLHPGEWHTPYVEPSELKLKVPISNNEYWEAYKKVSTGRCARVSYLTHDGKRDPQEDINLHDKLATSGHWSPFEHVATPLDNSEEYCGNFRGWKQYRKEFPNEYVNG